MGKLILSKIKHEYSRKLITTGIILNFKNLKILINLIFKFKIIEVKLMVKRTLFIKKIHPNYNGLFSNLVTLKVVYLPI